MRVTRYTSIDMTAMRDPVEAGGSAINCGLCIFGSRNAQCTRRELMHLRRMSSRDPPFAVWQQSET
eukprot:scaffold419882_cov43-Prasinocladus_malaysianus.AAC.1